MKLNFIFFIFLFSCLFLTACNNTKDIIYINNNEIKVEIADTQLEQQQGLMNREYLEEDSGMLFIFTEEEKKSFWMKNTLIPLDIIFISENYLINDIYSVQPCETDECELYSANAKYVLEVDEGYCEENNINVGDFVLIQ
jgi:uncharacterized protein